MSRTLEQGPEQSKTLLNNLARISAVAGIAAASLLAVETIQDTRGEGTVLAWHGDVTGKGDCNGWNTSKSGYSPSTMTVTYVSGDSLQGSWQGGDTHAEGQVIIGWTDSRETYPDSWSADKPKRGCTTTTVSPTVTTQATTTEAPTTVPAPTPPPTTAAETTTSLAINTTTTQETTTEVPTTVPAPTSPSTTVVEVTVTPPVVTVESSIVNVTNPAGREESPVTANPVITLPATS